MAGDAFATSRVAVEAVRLCWDVRDLPQLNAHVLILAKRRAQLKQVISDVVKEGLAILPQMGAREERAELITTLRTVTDGKIYVEVRACMCVYIHMMWRCVRAQCGVGAGGCRDVGVYVCVGCVRRGVKYGGGRTRRSIPHIESRHVPYPPPSTFPCRIVVSSPFPPAPPSTRRV